jgi:hypothetical protein
MSIEIREVGVDSDDYQRYFNQSPQSTIFHHDRFLNLLADHSKMNLKILVGFKGQEPVGVFPFFIDHKLSMTLVYSPPPGFGVAYLGPFLLNVEKLKRRKVEKRHRRFIEGCEEWVSSNLQPKYVRVRTSTRYEDPRPFQWNDFESSPRYTYSVDLNASTDEIKQSFSKSLRRYLDPDPEQPVEIFVGSHDGVDFVYEQIQSRYEAQQRTYPVDRAFLHDTYEQLPDENVKPYIGTVRGEMSAGIFVLQDENTSYFWQGGGKPDTEFPINDLLHWRIIRDGIESAREQYDLYGGNTERICKYKAKFSPALQGYHEIERDSMASKLYKLIQ